MGVLIGPMFNMIPEAMMDMAADLPEALLAAFGGGDMSTPEGWYQLETFGLMAPVALMIVTIVVGARALAGERRAPHHGTPSRQPDQAFQGRV